MLPVKRGLIAVQLEQKNEKSKKKPIVLSILFDFYGYMKKVLNLVRLP